MKASSNTSATTKKRKASQDNNSPDPKKLQTIDLRQVTTPEALDRHMERLQERRKTALELHADNLQKLSFGALSRHESKETKDSSEKQEQVPGWLSVLAAAPPSTTHFYRLVKWRVDENAPDRHSHLCVAPLADSHRGHVLLAVLYKYVHRYQGNLALQECVAAGLDKIMKAKIEKADAVVLHLSGMVDLLTGLIDQQSGGESEMYKCEAIEISQAERGRQPKDIALQNLIELVEASEDEESDYESD